LNTVGFIGAGKMGEAIVASLVDSGVLKSRDIYVSEIDEERRRLIEDRYGVNVLADNRQLIATSQVVFLAIKPQNLEEVLKEIGGRPLERHLFISIAAGIRIERIEPLLPGAKVVRVMPNIAATVAAGMNVFCSGHGLTEEDRGTTVTLLSCFGKVLELPEEQFDAVTALSGSGPAFFAHFLQLMAEGGVELGLSRADSELLAVQTMLGTAILVSEGKYGPGELIAAVSSAKGTTVAGMSVLGRAPLKQVVIDTLRAAAARSEELSRI